MSAERIGAHLEVEAQLAERDDAIVYLARDVRLDRRVAVTRYRGDDEALARRERQLQALAKVTDPHVAAIHEVGRDKGGLFVATEHLEGTSAAAWAIAAPRSSAENVAVWLAAARALAALHGAGLVHGELAAEHVQLGRSGARVCITGASGRSANADTRLADRRAWCAGLSAMHERVAMPGWLRRVLAQARGPADDPDMARIVAIVERRGRARRWLALAVGTATLAGVAGLALGARETPCSDGAERMAIIWSEARRNALAETFVEAAGEQGGSAWAHTDRALDEWAQRWIDARASSCLATRSEGTQSEAVLERSMSCFDHRAAELAALLDAFAEVDASTTTRAVEAANALPTPLACTDADFLLATIAPPTDAITAAAVELVRARLREIEALRRANRIPAASAASAGVREQAEACGYEPVQAEALIELARVALAGEREDEGIELMHEAVLAGRKSGDVAITAEASARLASDYARKGDAEQAESWLALAELEIERKAADPELTVDVERTRAYLLDRSGKSDEAIAHYQRALDQVIALHGDHWRASAVRSDIGIVLASGNRLDEAAPIFAEVIASLERELGPDTPQAGIAHANYGQLLVGLDRPEEAEQHLLRSITVIGALQGPDSPALFHSTLMLGSALSEQGRNAEAVVQLERAVEMGELRGGPESPEVGVAIGALATSSHNTGQLATALEQAQRGATILAKHFGVDNRDVLAARTQAAVTLTELGRRDDALAELHDILARCDRTQVCSANTLARALSAKAWIELKDDDLAAARASAERGLAAAEGNEVRDVTVSELQCTLAEVLLKSHGDKAKIRGLVDAAVPVVAKHSPEEGQRCAQLGA
ncbi:MAG TPA: tetratricopeptide repeat protein [Nannocystaceae bacterium]|nr:tetratricopeptide repeat protein [Nannocystaceae bacterium]